MHKHDKYTHTTTTTNLLIHSCLLGTLNKTRITAHRSYNKYYMHSHNMLAYRSKRYAPALSTITKRFRKDLSGGRNVSSLDFVCVECDICDMYCSSSFSLSCILKQLMKYEISTIKCHQFGRHFEDEHTIVAVMPPVNQ